MDDANVASNPVDEADLKSPTFEEAYEKASSTLKEPKEETPEVKEKEVEEKETQAEPDAEKPAEQEKTPLDQFDPEKLPDELKPLYKNLMKGFTQGRQKDREELNTLREELKAIKSQAETKVTPEETKNLTPEEYIDRVVKAKVTEEKVNAFREQAISDYDSLDPRLHKADDNGEYDSRMDAAIGAQLDKLLEQHINETGSELGFDYKSQAKELIKEWDDYLTSRVDAFNQKQREIAKKQERSFQKTYPKGSGASTKPSGNMSLEQAISAAIKKTQN